MSTLAARNTASPATTALPTGMAPSSKRKRNDVEPEEDDTASADDADATLEFGWEEQAAHTGGRQRKLAAKKKHKPGTFGTSP